MIDVELQKVFAKSISYAKANSHEYITQEHIFLYLIQDEHIFTLLDDLDIDVNEVMAKLKEYIVTNTPKFPEEFKNDDPIETITVTSIIENMIVHIQLSGKESAGIEYMFVAILYKDDYYSPQALYRAGEVFELLGKREEAIRAYQEIVKSYQTSNLYEKAKERIKALGES